MHGRSLTGRVCSALTSFPDKVDNGATLQRMVTMIHTLQTCVGNPDSQYITVMKSRKGKNCSAGVESAIMTIFNLWSWKVRLIYRLYVECSGI